MVPIVEDLRVLVSDIDETLLTSTFELHDTFVDAHARSPEEIENVAPNRDEIERSMDDVRRQYAAANKESELKKEILITGYHLIITNPVILSETEPTEGIIEDHINTVLAQLYSGYDIPAVPFEFRNHKIERGEGVETELWIGLKPKIGSTISENIPSFLKCLFRLKNESIVRSISELSILGIRPVPGTAVQERWEFEILGNIWEARIIQKRVSRFRKENEGISRLLGSRGLPEW
ncbi:hypothetical protein TWF281_011465 [Arthrobotrys megalospora]